MKAELPRAARAEHAADLYLDLLKDALCGALREHVLYPVAPKPGGLKQRFFAPIRHLLGWRGFVLARSFQIGPQTFAQSPPPYIPHADTLIGPAGLENIRECVDDVLEHQVPGDLIEAGVWRGGASVYLRAVLEAYGDAARTVWVADSFAGMPKPEETGYEADAGEDQWAEMDHLVVSLEDVKRTFARYGFLDDRVRFLHGWFRDTLPAAPIERLALIRLDGDMYGSTMDALKALYPRLSPGGYLIVDDYWLPKCREAVDDYRRAHGITEEIRFVDRAIAFWRRRCLAVTTFITGAADQGDAVVACWAVV